MERKTLVEQSDLHRRTIERYLYQNVRPHPKHEAKLTEIALRHASKYLLNKSSSLTGTMEVILYRYLGLFEC
jgi:hypothetical protein